MDIHISNWTHKFQNRTGLDAKANSELYKSNRVCSVETRRVDFLLQGDGRLYWFFHFLIHVVPTKRILCLPGGCQLSVRQGGTVHRWRSVHIGSTIHQISWWWSVQIRRPRMPQLHRLHVMLSCHKQSSESWRCFLNTMHKWTSSCPNQRLKVVGIEKLGGLVVCLLIVKGTGPWWSIPVYFLMGPVSFLQCISVSC
jgi:hypothetical protein